MNTKDKTAQHMPGPLLTLREKDDRSEAACGCHAIRNVLGHVRMVQCHIHTAAPELLAALNKAEAMGFIHERVKHSAGQFVKGQVHTQTIDGFWSQFKRSVNGTYHQVSPKHLQTYLDEFCFRYSHRDDEAPLMETLLGRIA